MHFGRPPDTFEGVCANVRGLIDSIPIDSEKGRQGDTLGPTLVTLRRETGRLSNSGGRASLYSCSQGSTCWPRIWQASEHLWQARTALHGAHGHGHEGGVVES